MRAYQPTQKRCPQGWRFIAGLAVLVGWFGTAQAEPQIKLAQAAPSRMIKTLPMVSTNAFGFEVRTVYPSKIQGRVTFSKVAWSCQGNVCTTNVKYPGFGVSACHALAMKIGHVRSFRLIKHPPTLVPIKGYPFSAEQIAQCNQGVSGPKNIKMNTRLSVPALNTRVTGSGTTMGQDAKRAKTIGEAGNRMKQAKELQRLHDMGTPMDQAMGGGTAVQQDCSRSANRAKCLRDNMNAGKAPAGPSGGGMSDCLLAGGNLSSCFSAGRRNGGSGAGRISNGPGGAADGANIPGRGQAQSGGKGDGSHWGQWRASTNRGQAGEHGMYRQSDNDDGSQSLETVTTNSRTGNTTREIFTFTSGQNGGTSQSTTTNADGQVMSVITQQSYADGSSQIETKRYNNDGDVTSTTTTVIPADAGGQAAPDSASGSAPDNCNWNPALGKCMTNRPNPKGMTSQPGPDGENTGGILGHNTPKTDIGAAINCGDASAEACNRDGAGLNNGAKRLDMKDKGPAPGGSPH